ncbi:unnamed protein product [Cylindrotheca closterium]|uniref:Uncharacterized protein n=1 Tax=Cylindrotheca closterium TaxID=2856 RepID=A0AAD2JHG9_9STRA|nr:unnamed protein product [Cylindrotheca closterium]
MSTSTSNTRINFSYPQHSSKWCDNDEDYDYCDEYDDYDDFNIGPTTTASSIASRRQQPKQGKSGGSIYSAKHIRAKEAMQKRARQTPRRK